MPIQSNCERKTHTINLLIANAHWLGINYYYFFAFVLCKIVSSNSLIFVSGNCWIYWILLRQSWGKENQKTRQCTNTLVCFKSPHPDFRCTFTREGERKRERGREKERETEEERETKIEREREIRGKEIERERLERELWSWEQQQQVIPLFSPQSHMETILFWPILIWAVLTVLFTYYVYVAWLGFVYWCQ